MRAPAKLLTAAILLIASQPVLAEPGVGPGIALGVPAPTPRTLRAPRPKPTPARVTRFRVPVLPSSRSRIGTHPSVQSGEGPRRPTAVGGPAAAFSGGGSMSSSLSPDRMIGL